MPYSYRKGFVAAICLWLGQLGFSIDAYAALPQVALYSFSSSTEAPEHQKLTAVVSELLLVELSQSSTLELLDRSFILNVLEEKGSASKAVGSSGYSTMLSKLPVSQFLVTGTLIEGKKSRYLSARFVHSATGKILGSYLGPLDTENLEATVAKVAGFVNQQAATATNHKLAIKNSIGIGNFKDVGSGTDSLGRGDLLRDGLVTYYRKTMDVLARSETFPLYLESYISQLQFKQNQSAAIESVSLYVSGQYEVESDGKDKVIRLVLFLDNMDSEKRWVTLIQGTNWLDIYEKSIAYLDSLIVAPTGSVSDVDRKTAEERYQAAVSLNEYRKSVRGNVDGKQWFYLLPRWDEKRAQHADKTIELLQQALELDPWHAQARLFLAYTLMHRPGMTDREGRQHLAWLLFHADHPSARQEAANQLRSGDLKPGSFNGIVADPERLFAELVSSHYLNGDGSLGRETITSKPELKIPGYSKKEMTEIYAVLVHKLWGVGSLSDQQFTNSLKNETQNREARLRFKNSRAASGVSMASKINYIWLDTKPANTGQRSLKELSQAIDEMATAVFLDSDFYTGKLYLAHMFRSYGTRYLPYSDLIFESVMNGTHDDNLKFLAALPIGKLSETEFTPSFEIRIDKYLKQARETGGPAKVRTERQPELAIVKLAENQQEIKAFNQRVNPGGDIRRISLPAFLNENGDEEPGVKNSGVALFGEQLIVGMGNKGSGKVSVYNRSDGGWKLAQVLKGNKPFSSNRRDWFGRSLNMHDDLLIVGAPLDDHAVPLKKEAFEKSSLTSVFNSEKLLSMLFERGYIDIYGVPTGKNLSSRERKAAAEDFPELSREQTGKLMTIVRGALSQEDVGSAYIFRKKGAEWIREAQLEAPDGYIKNRFGSRVAVEGETALVCGMGRQANIYANEQTANNKGGAYIFENNRNGWRYVEKITSGMCFDVALSNGFAFVTTSEQGDLSIFKKVDKQWTRWQTLEVENAVKGVSSIAVSDRHLVATAPWDDRKEPYAKRAGSAYVFKKAGDRWQFEGKLYGPGDETAWSEFGSAVAISDNYLAIGAQSKPGITVPKIESGKVYLYKRANRQWKLSAIISPLVELEKGEFGGALTLDGDKLIIASTHYGAASRLYQYQIKN